MAGAVIASVGVGVLAGARRGRDRVLASLPLVLGVHQLVEALVWWDTQGRVSAGLGRAAVDVWAVIAFVVLPTLLPVGVWVAVRPVGGVRRRLSVCLGCGLVVSVVMLVRIVLFGVTASAHGHVLEYGLGVASGAGYVLVGGYLVAALGAPLVSGDRLLRWFGVLASAGAVGCAAAWRLAFASTWCGFAAVLSLWLLVWVRRRSGGGVVRSQAG